MADYRTAPIVTHFEVSSVALLLTLASGEGVTLHTKVTPHLSLIPQGGPSVLLTNWQSSTAPAYTIPQALVNTFIAQMNLKTTRELELSSAAVPA